MLHKLQADSNDFTRILSVVDYFQHFAIIVVELDSKDVFTNSHKHIRIVNNSE